jgi:ankyrin repeat protein
MTDVNIWELLEDLNYVDEIYDEENKQFAIKTYQANLDYLKNNYQNVTNLAIRYECFMISCVFSNSIDVIQFIVDKFKIQPNFINKYSNNCLLLACQKSSLSNFPVIKYLIEVLKLDVNYVNKYNNTCLLHISERDNNMIEVFKYMIEKCQLDFNHANMSGRTPLLTLCKTKNNTDIIKYLISQCKVNIDHTNMYGYNCLLIACYTQPLHFIKYLIEECKMDTKHTNMYGYNCLLIACYTQPLHFIKYLIEECKMDTKHTNNYKQNCLMIACTANSLDVIKYLVEECKMNLFEIDKYKGNCLKHALTHNKSLDVIKYLIEDCKMDKFYVDDNGKNYLFDVCEWNTNISVLKYLVEECKLDLRAVNKKNQCILSFAIENNSSIDIIQYLVEESKTDIHCIHKEDLNLLALACVRNKSVAVIDYLVSVHKMNIYATVNNFKNYLGLAFKYNSRVIIKHLIKKYDITLDEETKYTCLLAACEYNNNLDSIKYLIETYNLDINYNKKVATCLSLVCQNDMNLEIAKYFIEETDVNIAVQSIPEKYWRKIIPCITNNYFRLNELIEYGITKKYKINDVKINPLFVDPKIRNKINIDNPYDFTFNAFKKLVNALSCFVPIDTKNKIEKNNIYNHDFTENELLFEHNHQSYYGNKSIVYDSIIVLKEIRECAKFNEVISLSGTSPKYFMNLWLNAIYFGHLDIFSIKTSDISICLRHIDQYPMVNVSIKSLENEIIQYFEINGLIMDDYIEDMIEKYQLKSLYLYVHNKFINDNKKRNVMNNID